MSDRLYDASSALVALLFAVFIAVSCAAMFDYFELTVGHGEGDSTFEERNAPRIVNAETFVAATFGWNFGARSRHRDEQREQDRRFKRMIAAQDRAQYAFLTRTAAPAESDLLGNPIDILKDLGGEKPKTMNEAWIALISAVSLAILAASVYFLRRQHLRRRQNVSVE